MSIKGMDHVCFCTAIAGTKRDRSDSDPTGTCNTNDGRQDRERKTSDGKNEKDDFRRDKERRKEREREKEREKDRFVAERNRLCVCVVLNNVQRT